MSTVIYQDSERTITVDKGFMQVRGARGEKRISLVSEVAPIQAAAAAAVKNAGLDPTGWYQVQALKAHGGHVLGVFPPETREAVSAAISDYARALEAVRNDPSAIERARIEDLFASANRSYDRGDWAQYHIQLREAEEALAAWKAKFPEQAAAERRASLLAEANRLDDLAVGALVYDADGSFSREHQEERAANFRAKAAAIRQRAEAI